MTNLQSESKRAVRLLKSLNGDRWILDVGETLLRQADAYVSLIARRAQHRDQIGAT